MTNELGRTFCDIDIILNALPEEDRNKVPKKLRKLIEENKLDGYESTVRVDVPIEEQELHPDTQAFIGMLYLYYWCETEEEKRELKKLYIENVKRYQKELQEKYEVFKNDNNQVTEIENNETESEEVMTKNAAQTQDSQIIVYKESIIRKILNKVMSIFRRKEYGK